MASLFAARCEVEASVMAEVDDGIRLVLAIWNSANNSPGFTSLTRRWKSAPL